jgi:hypothetical protein
MKNYRRILLASLSTCPSVAQLVLCRDLLRQGDCQARVVWFQERSRIFESDGPAGIFPQEELVRSKVADARQRLGLLLENGGLERLPRSVLAGEPQALLARELKTWHPDLVVVTRGWGHARRVARAARAAGIPVPAIRAVAPDHLLRKLLNAFLPLSAGFLRLPGSHFEDAFHGGHHHPAS